MKDPFLADPELSLCRNQCWQSGCGGGGRGQPEESLGGRQGGRGNWRRREFREETGMWESEAPTSSECVCLWDPGSGA